jgi:ABC-type amino acid transport substrate-binding protein
LYAVRRLLPPALGGVVALLAALAPAHAQSQLGAAAVQATRVRILAVSTPPLADEQLPEGGLVLALVGASLGLEPGAALLKGVRWTSETLTPALLTDKIDLALPVEGADCDQPNDLSQASAMLCDGTLYSEPILQVVVALFSLTGNGFTFGTDESIYGKSICLVRDHELSALNAKGRNWVAYKRVTVLRRPTLLDCIAAVQAREADAFAATDLEGSHLLRRLGLTQYYTMQARPLATRGVHAVVAREHPNGATLLERLNAGLKRLKTGDAYAAILQKHLTVPVPRPALPRTSALPPSPRASPPLASSPYSSAPAAKAEPPVLDQAKRATALTFLKKGDEELADGRVAPARLFYSRAAEMGLAQAAMALGATYDEAELNKPHLSTVQPDSEEARRWYERARALGAADAETRLQRLSGR